MSEGPPPAALLFAEARALAELAAFWATLPFWRALPRGDGHPVLVLPGLQMTDLRTAPLRFFLQSIGYLAPGRPLRPCPRLPAAGAGAGRDHARHHPEPGSEGGWHRYAAGAVVA